MELDKYIAIAVVLSAIITGLMEVVKATFGDILKARFYPICSLALGIGVAEFAGRITTSYSWSELAIAGAISGLIASGLFAVGKTKEMQSNALSSVNTPHG